MKRILIGGLAAAGLLLGVVVPGTASADKGNSDKVTICHATSSEDNPFVTLTIARVAAYGPAGHFNENGTTQAGHEDDYLGECVQPTTTTEPEVTTTTEPEVTTTTEPEVTTTQPEVTTTTEPEVTTTQPEVTTTTEHPCVGICGPASVPTTHVTDVTEWCFMPDDRTFLEPGNYVVSKDGAGTTRWTFQKCGPPSAVTTTQPSVATTVPSKQELPKTGTSSWSLAALAAALLAGGLGIVGATRRPTD
jgi:LPXTG-motif cell wall-anchored protein